MNFEFAAAERQRAVGDRLFYLDSEQSFYFETNVRPGAMASLSVDRLQINVEVEGGRLLYIDGFHPRSLWKESPIEPPEMRSGTVTLLADHRLVGGVAMDLRASADWETRYDPVNGWVLVSEEAATSDDTTIEIAAGEAVTLKDGALTCLWLKPEWRP